MEKTSIPTDIAMFLTMNTLLWPAIHWNCQECKSIFATEFFEDFKTLTFYFVVKPISQAGLQRCKWILYYILSSDLTSWGNIWMNIYTLCVYISYAVGSSTTSAQVYFQRIFLKTLRHWHSISSWSPSHKQVCSVVNGFFTTFYHQIWQVGVIYEWIYTHYVYIFHTLSVASYSSLCDPSGKQSEQWR